MPYEVDFVTFKIVDKKLMKRTAIQEQVIFPLRAYDYVTSVAGEKGRAHRFRLRQIHHPLGQGADGGDARERRWQTPDLHRGK